MMQNDSHMVFPAWWIVCNESGASGPFTSAQMLHGVHSGYINDSCLIKTLSDSEFYTLRVYTDTIGGSPFILNFPSMGEALARNNAMLSAAYSGASYPTSAVFQNAPLLGYNPQLSSPYGCISPLTVMSNPEGDTDGELSYFLCDSNSTQHEKEKAFRRVRDRPELPSVPGSAEKSCQTDCQPEIVIQASEAADALSSLVGLPVVVGEPAWDE